MSIDAYTKETATNPERHITQTKFWYELMRDVFGPRKGGAIIFIDAQNARKGVAKTSAATAVGSLIAKQFNYDLKLKDFTLAGSEYLKRYQEHPGKEQPSVLGIDEFVGAGSGDARRAMSNENVDFGRAWQLLRTKRVVTLATLPDWNEADPRLQKYADYRLWCRERPIGYFQPYKVTVPFNSAGSGAQVRTKGLSYDSETPKIKFPNMDAINDPYYQYLTERKDELIHSNTWDANALLDEDDADDLTQEEMEKRELTKVAIRLYEPWNDDNDLSYEDVATAIDERTDTWVGNRIREWKKGEHRDLVPDPNEK